MVTHLLPEKRHTRPILAMSIVAKQLNGSRCPQFLANARCGQTAGWTKMLLGIEVGLSPGDLVLDGDPAPSPKRGRSPQFSAHVYCDQTAAWIKMPLGMEVGLNPGDFVFDGTQPSLPKKGAETPPQFSAHVYCGQSAEWIKMALGTEVGLGPSTVC